MAPGLSRGLPIHGGGVSLVIWGSGAPEAAPGPISVHVTRQGRKGNEALWAHVVLTGPTRGLPSGVPAAKGPGAVQVPQEEEAGGSHGALKGTVVRLGPGDWAGAQAPGEGKFLDAGQGRESMDREGEAGSLM